MSLKTLLGLACGVALLAPGTAAAAATASISGPDTAVRGVSTGWTGSASGLNGAYGGYSMSWDMTDDGTNEYSYSWYTGVYHTYTTLGPKTIKLTAQGHGAQGLSATATKTITVVNAVPTVAFSCDEKAEVGVAAVCEIDSVDDPDTEQPPTLTWDTDGDGFDDGTGSEVAAAYSTTGTKTVRLRAVDGDGGETIAEDTVSVWAPAPGVAFAINPNPVVAGNDVTFTAPLAPGEAGDTRYQRKWDLDGDGMWDRAGEGLRTVSMFYDEAEAVQVRMWIVEIGAAPETAQLTTQTLVVNAKPKAQDKPSGGGSGSTGGSTAGGSSTAAPAPVAAPAPIAARPTFAPAAATKAPAAAKKKKPAAKKTCKWVKGKNGKRTRKCTVLKKSKKSRRVVKKR